MTSSAHSIIKKNTYDSKAALETYNYWLSTGPFDCGMTISNALRGKLSNDSQANGAMMRISPLGIFGANYELEQVENWAMQDAMLTHPNPVCVQANALYTMAIAYAIKTGISAQELYKKIVEWAKSRNTDKSLWKVILKSEIMKPYDFINQQGWVLIAFQNALWQLLHADNLEEGIVGTIMCGGDTDTNGAICGALLGSVCGSDAIPVQWKNCLLNCRSDENNPNINHPRPEEMWPVDVLVLTEELINN